MMKQMRKAQTMVEYIIIIAIVAIALIGVFTYMSKAVGTKAAGVTDKLSSSQGNEAKSAVDRIGESSIRDLGE